MFYLYGKPRENTNNRESPTGSTPVGKYHFT